MRNGPCQRALRSLRRPPVPSRPFPTARPSLAAIAVDSRVHGT